MPRPAFGSISDDFWDELLTWSLFQEGSLFLRSTAEARQTASMPALNRPERPASRAERAARGASQPPPLR